MFSTEAGRKEFGLKCTLAEKKHTQVLHTNTQLKIHQTQQDICILTEEYESTQNPELEDKIISLTGKLSVLRTTHKVLEYQLSEVKNTEKHSGTLGYRAKVAEEKLLENLTF